MAPTPQVESVGERQEQWRQLEKHWRDSLEEATGNNDSESFEIDTLEELNDNLRDFRISDANFDHDGLNHLLEQLAPVMTNLKPFADAITEASQYSSVSALLWTGLLSVVKKASKDQVVPSKIIELFNVFSYSFRPLEENTNSTCRFTIVQHALQDLFEDYMGFCTHVCSYFNRPAYASMHTNVYSKSPRGILEIAKSRISRHIRKFREAVLTGKQRERARQESEIANLLPPGISDMPLDIDRAVTEASIEFPVTTVIRTRNSAFVGREELLDEIAEKLSNHDRAPQNSVSGQHGQPRNSQTAASSLQRFMRKSSSLASASNVRAARQEEIIDRGSSVSRPDTDSATENSAILNSASSVCVLHGIGGVGKTQVALEYYHTHRDEYDACFWIDAEHDWTLASTFARIADKLGLLPQKTTDDGGHEVQNKAIEESRNWLQSTLHRWLLIFDNVEDFGDLARYMPTENRSRSSVIITTQSPNVPVWFDNVGIVQVKAMDADTAAECIFRYLDRDPDEEEERELACQLAEHVGCLPLAMATIGGYVKQSQISLEEFFENIKLKAHLWKKAPQIQDTQAYERSLITVFSKAFEDLKPAARELLNVIAFLDPDFIPEEIFIKAIQKKLFKHVSSKNDLLDCYFELRSRQLIRRDTSSKDPYISVHRSIQWNVLLDLSADNDQRWQYFRKAYEIVRLMLPKTNPLAITDPTLWPPYSRHGRQILELRSHCLWPEPPIHLPLEFAQALSDMGTYMWFSGKFPEGRKILGTAENILDENKAKFNDPLRAHVYLTLGIITSFEGVSERKNSMYFRKQGYHARNQGIGRKKQEDLTREEDVLIWKAHSDLAFGFIQQEDFESTRSYMEECLEQYKRWEVDEMALPYEYAKYYQLMSFCHMADQKPVEAIQAITRCLELMQKAAGTDHPMAVLIKFCHANLLWHTGGQEMRRQALKIHKAVLEFRRMLLGEFSHFTLESYSTCGKLCHEVGELQEARKYLTTCLQRRKRVCWNEEGITRAQFRYANVLGSLAEQARTAGDENAARQYAEDRETKWKEVTKIIQRYRKEYEKYMPQSEEASEEENLDQMVSFWAGRFTGGLKQPKFDLTILEDTDDERRPTKRRRTDDVR